MNYEPSRHAIEAFVDYEPYIGYAITWLRARYKKKIIITMNAGCTLSSTAISGFSNMQNKASAQNNRTLTTCIRPI